MSSRLPRVKKVAKTLKAHLGGLLTYFKHRISNALTEGFNSKIQALKADARGFRKFENYRTRILFFCGRLDLGPYLPSAPTHSIP
jgi:transposase